MTGSKQAKQARHNQAPGCLCPQPALLQVWGLRALQLTCLMFQNADGFTSFPSKIDRISHKQNNSDPSKSPLKIHALRIQPSLGLSGARDLDFHTLNVTEGVQWGQWPILSARLRHPRAVPNLLFLKVLRV